MTLALVTLFMLAAANWRASCAGASSGRLVGPGGLHRLKSGDQHRPDSPWMPWQLAKIGRCETGMDFRAGGSRYVTAFGIWVGNADRARRALGYPADWRTWTPAMQVRVALWHERWVARTYHLQTGWSSWGCWR